MSDNSSLGLFKIAVAVVAVFVVYKAIQRLFFHPLSAVPGPWYAAVSTLYEFYWDCLKSGKYHTRINAMHEKYGPIVRVNPYEVHVNDPIFVDVISDSRVEKDPFFYGAFGIPESAICTVSPDLHRVRRGAMAQFFSKANVSKLEPRVVARVKQLCGRIEQFAKDDKAITLSNAFRCLTTDIVTDYAVPKTRNYLDHPNFNAAFTRVIRNTAALSNWNRHIPFVIPSMLLIPRQVVAWFDKEGSIVALVDNQNDFMDQAKAVVENEKTKETQTVINAIFEHPSLHPAEKTIRRIFDETETVISAGTETTASTLSSLTYLLCANPHVYRTLREELDAAAIKNGITKEDGFLGCKILEPLPYLQAVMKEILRYSSAVVGRIPRRNPDEPMKYTDPANQKTYTIPSPYVASMSSRDVHFNPDIFPEPYTFSPERWLTTNNDAAQLARQEKYMVAFGKGMRACLGLELAKQEILLVAGNLFWKYEFELWETTGRDVEFVHDFFSPFGPADSEGVRVKVVG